MKAPFIAVSATEEKTSHSERHKPNWKPWRTSPAVVLPLLLLSAAISGILIWQERKGARPMTEATFRATWFEWYRFISNASAVDIQAIVAAPYTFNKSSTCVEGLVDLDTSSGGTFFLWNYLPSIAATAVAIVWGVVDSEVKRIEPFYQASQPGGAIAKSSLFAEYISLPSFLSPFQALYWKQWTVFLASCCYVIMSTVTPILQAFLFQSYVQLLQIGYIGYPGHGEPPRFEAFDKFNTYQDWKDETFYENNSPGLFWNCYTTNDYTEDYLQSQGSKVNDINPVGAAFADTAAGALYDYLSLNRAASIAQAALLLIVAVLGVAFLFRRRRRSGMLSSWGDSASLASLLTVDPAIRSALANLVDLNRARSAAWSDHLKRQRVHLGYSRSGNVAPAANNTTGTATYGLYIEHVEGQVPDIQGSELLDNQPYHQFRLAFVPHLVYIALGILAIISAISGNALNNNPYAVSVYSNSSVTLPIITLVLSAVVKSIWRLLEHRSVSTPLLGLRTGTRNLALAGRQERPLRQLGQQYSRALPGSLTVRAFRNGQTALGMITLIGLLIEVLIVLAGILTSISHTRGLGVQTFNALSWCTVGLAGFLCVFVFLSSGVILVRIPPNLRHAGGLCDQLSLFCSSRRLLDSLAPLREMTDDKAKLDHLDGLNGTYGYALVPASSLSGGHSPAVEQIQPLAQPP